MVVDLDDPLEAEGRRDACRCTGARATRAAVPLPLRHRPPTGSRSIDVTVPGKRAARRRRARAARRRARRLRRAHLRLRRRRHGGPRDRRRREARSSRGCSRRFNAERHASTTRATSVVGSTNASLFAYVADGSERPQGGPAHRARHAAASSTASAPSRKPEPDRVARDRIARARAVAKGLDRDRAVDETGDQIAVFGRIGSRPFTLEEQRKLYLEPARRRRGQVQGRDRRSADAMRRLPARCLARARASAAPPRAAAPLPQRSRRDSNLGRGRAAPAACATARSRRGRTRTSCRTSTSPGRASTSTRRAPTSVLLNERSQRIATQPRARRSRRTRRSSASTATRYNAAAGAARRALQRRRRRELRGVPRARRSAGSQPRRARRDPRGQRRATASIRPTSRVAQARAVPVVPLRQRATSSSPTA